MTLHKTIQAVTDRIRARSETTRGDYLDRMAAAAAEGPRRAHLTCGNQAHAYAPMGEDKGTLAATQAGNIGIITAYNDMLSAHQPFEHYLAALALEVHGQAPLVAVQGQETRRPVLDEGRTHAAVVVAAVGFLDFNYVGPHVGQYHGAVGPGHDLGQVQHHHSRQG